MSNANKLAHRVVETYGLRDARREVAASVLRRLDRIDADLCAAVQAGDIEAVIACARRSQRASAMGDAILEALDDVTVH